MYPKKRLGQHFLVNRSILKRIVEKCDVNKEDTVIEIGAGLGNLTEYLIKEAGKVIAIEKDPSLIPLLRDRFRLANNLEVVCADSLQFPYAEISVKEQKKLTIVGNIPFYLTSPLLFQRLEVGAVRNSIMRIVFLIQREVGIRIVASSGIKDYGVISIICQAYAKATLLFEVKRGSFYPSPKVDSSLIRLDILENPKVEKDIEETFKILVRYAFQKRRKTILNSLKDRFSALSKEDLKGSLKDLDIYYMRRGETLSIEEFRKLARYLSTHYNLGNP
ncbi:MAG: 16S rRNA (adenine(1518)-N(6)/adenine(1519)-N(6))-dimethyltransferase RsmA [bacterium]|nr:16S rRNA (adenine(1518)-N(6)/adenine(1519)-N(6))-dimethyltransferase RsmA [bacterium]